MFKTYAEYRIKGAMLDEIRSYDWASRYYRDQIKKVRKLKEEMSLRGELNYQEIQKQLNIDDFRFYELLKRAEQNAKITEIENFESNDLSQHDEILDFVQITQQINALETSEKAVMHSYYFDHKSMKEIAKDLSISESRVSQIHKKAIQSIRYEMTLVA